MEVQGIFIFVLSNSNICPIIDHRMPWLRTRLMHQIYPEIGVTIINIWYINLHSSNLSLFDLFYTLKTVSIKLKFRTPAGLSSALKLTMRNLLGSSGSWTDKLSSFPNISCVQLTMLFSFLSIF